MKIPVHITTLALFAACTLGAGAAPDSQAVIRFHNDDQLTGKLKALGEESLVWESDILAEPATFDLEHVLNLTLDAENKAPESSHVAILTLKNEDEVRGQLGGITDEHINIETWFAGPMKFRRSMVSKIQIEGGEPAVGGSRLTDA